MSNLINQPFVLSCGQTIKNRICKAAMTERIAEGNNLAHQGHTNLYKNGQKVILGFHLQEMSKLIVVMLKVRQTL